ncbi:hypothetical protein DH2020_007863 [Rehmannia glutinosa]|uniref:Reverse transcriptase domain-containing protein n=1 Tax=Rehmannia glutinosa TaxID=99300 RepID=A0ABR0TZD9_REHGL
MDRTLDAIEPRMTDERNKILACPFEEAEVVTALTQMHPTKSPGSDGMPALFFQTFWPIIKNDVLSVVLSVLNGNVSPKGVNDTNIVLIPKCNNPSNLKDWRPISLSNVVYKILVKVLANKLQKVILHLISSTQSEFVPGRSIIDNVQIAFEILHSMKRKLKGKIGDVALKINISKAYDSMNWSFLQAIMLKMGFDSTWVRWIMMCVTSVCYSIGVNGEEVGPIIPERVLRQGDPLSQYLFILCAEGLSFLIKDAEDNDRIHGVRVCRRTPFISHLFFADDSLLFSRASIDECNYLKNILEAYKEASGQGVNFGKSGVMFSSNMPHHSREALCQNLGVRQNLNSGKYLGLPSLIGRKKKEVFRHIKDIMWGYIQNWQGNKLSRGGKEILLNSVAQVVPSYFMSTLLLPISY